MKKLLMALGATLMLAGCGVNPIQAIKALEAQGMTQVQIGGRSWFGCAENDAYASNFTALGANGKRVTGVVCAGLFKGVTVRFN